MFWKLRINKHERGLLFRYGDFERLLTPGVYRLWSRFWSRNRARVEIVDTLATRFTHKLLDLFANDEQVRDALKVVDLTDKQRALVWRDGRVAWLLGPGRHAFWRSPYNLHVEVYNINDFRFEHQHLDAVLVLPDADKWLHGVQVDAHEQVLLFRDGRLVEKLGEGRHVFWKGVGRVTWKTVDQREQLADVAGQEIMTRDKVTLRVNLLVAYRVADAGKAATVVSDYAQTLYREAQLALRAAVGTRPLDTLLADKEAIGNEVRGVLARRAAEFGVEVKSVGLRDIILPGEMKLILNQVITAEKQAQANLIKRREETAAARSQANTARLLAENPTLARIKELESLQEILAGVKATFVLGSGDIAEQVRGLVRKDALDSG